jgi:hypothetical protein
MCILGAVLMTGCFAEITVTLRIDNVPFLPTDCHNGVRYGFTGVELVDASGRRLQASIERTREFGSFFPTRHGIPTVTVFEPGASRGHLIGACGSMTVTEQTSKVSVRNVEGSANLSCRGGEHSISGHLEFENCH